MVEQRLHLGPAKKISVHSNLGCGESPLGALELAPRKSGSYWSIHCQQAISIPPSLRESTRARGHLCHTGPALLAQMDSACRPSLDSQPPQRRYR